MAGAPIGNKNAGKSKPWTDAIRRAIARRDSDVKNDNDKFLNRLADQLLDDCLNKEPMALNELTNRLDGKFAQPLTGDDENPLTLVQKIELVAMQVNGNSEG